MRVLMQLMVSSFMPYCPALLICNSMLKTRISYICGETSIVLFALTVERQYLNVININAKKKVNANMVFITLFNIGVLQKIQSKQASG